MADKRLERLRAAARRVPIVRVDLQARRTCIGCDARDGEPCLDDCWAQALELAIDDECNCDPLAQTGGGHAYTCPAFEPECTCYEVTGGHQPGCYFNRNPKPEL